MNDLQKVMEYYKLNKLDCKTSGLIVFKRGKEKVFATWFSYLANDTVKYIGDLGGYNNMLSKGYIHRLKYKPYEFPSVKDKKIIKKNISYKEEIILNNEWETTFTMCGFKDGKTIPDTCISCSETENGFVVYFDNIRKDWQNPLFGVKEFSNPKCKEMTKEEFNNMFKITSYYQVNKVGQRRVLKN